ncbi:hypothetical protein CDAR_220871 [Caerostris darwini]|uniref:RING-type domain-containing protein n=1 Tax=Caerostris darwini TaxID=1538125 RepID=A0AAV4UR27_9ARAC|nr:hypothetical protein CDAR_220871 [Caerostris darwini]
MSDFLRSKIQGYLIMAGVQKRRRQPMRSVKKLSSFSGIGKEAPLKRENAAMKPDIVDSENICKNEEAVAPSDPKCSVCLDTSRRKNMKYLPCSHVFHRKCINRWLKKNRRCPICRNITLRDSSPPKAFVPLVRQNGVSGEDFVVTLNGYVQLKSTFISDQYFAFQSS